MNVNSPFVRKVIYIIAIMLLLFPLFVLGQPASTTTSGGKLSQLRESYGLSQAQLGDIDPVSVSMQLATFGLRGVAVNILWDKAARYQMTEDFDNLSATLNQITKLQPHFIGVWKFQAHNLSYNISAEFDDFRQRYHWVKRGINFLIDGTRYNRDQPRMLQDVGDYIGNKIGTSDERVEFRELFQEDRDFHQSLSLEEGIDTFSRRSLGPTGAPDNWLVAWQWYQKSENAVDPLGVRPLGRTPLQFFVVKPRTLISFAAAIEEEGFLDEKGREAYRRAAEGWNELGNREILHNQAGFPVRMNDQDVHRQARREIRDQIIALDLELYEQMLATREQSLEKLEREALAKPAADRTPDQYNLALDAESKLEISNAEFIERLSEELKPQAEELNAVEAEKYQYARAAEHHRMLTNYDYFRMRCQVEQLKLATDARQVVRHADEFYANAELEKARSEYERGWDMWAEIFEEFPELLNNPEAEILRQSVGNYESLLGHLEESIPEDFKLRILMMKYEDMNQLPADFDPTGRANRQPPGSQK